MYSSVSFIRSAWSDTAEQMPRRDAEVLLPRSRDLLIGLLHWIAGDEGLALCHAFRDIVMDGEIVPSAWPIEEVVDVRVERVLTFGAVPPCG